MKKPQVQNWVDSFFVFGDKFFDFEKLCDELAPLFVPSIDQVHGIQGLIIDRNTFDCKGYKSVQADFIITNKSRVLLSILTADCLPIFLYDPISSVIGAVHAGWRGLAAGVLDNAITGMCSTFKADSNNILLLVGPSAKSCCYQVKEDCVGLIKYFDPSDIVDQVLIPKNLLLYFDLVAYAVLRANKVGILPENIDTRFSCCTMCTEQFFSYRKDRRSANRNVNGIMLF